MEFGLRGRKIAVLVGGGIDRNELEDAWNALEQEGAELHMFGPEDADRSAAGFGANAQRAVENADAGDYVALVLPGGDVSLLAGNEHATEFVRAMMEADKPVAAIGKGTSLLVAANAVRGRTVAADQSLRQQIDGAGGSCVEKSLEVDQKLITCSNSKAVPSLGKRLAKEISNKLDSAKVDQLSQQSFPASDPPPGPGSIGAASATNSTRGGSGTR